MCVVVPVLIAGSMDLVTIAEMQQGWFTNWFIFHDPFTFITFWVYFTCATASVNRAPFDLAEAESELVAGFHTEYSGLRWSFFFMAEYGSMFAVSGLAAILFFGGWNGPVPIVALARPGRTDNGLVRWRALPRQSARHAQFHVQVRASASTFMMWVRWTLPRLRIDQVMKTCLKYCTPIAAVMFLGAMLWTYVVPRRIVADNRIHHWPTYARRLAAPEVGRQKSEVGSQTSNVARDDSVGHRHRCRDRTAARRSHVCQARELTVDMQSINWHSVFFLLFAAGGLRLRAGGRVHEQHRADGVLSGPLAGRDGRACFFWPAPISSARCNC